MLTGKRRTRQHIIADLSVNYIERLILKSGDVPQRALFDYGYDVLVHTFDERGDYESGYYLLQLKASDKPNALAKPDAFALTLQRRDVSMWLRDKSPVFVLFYDAPNEKAYWCHVQAELTLLHSQRTGGATLTVPVRRQQVVDEEAVRMFQRMKNELIEKERKDDSSD